MADRRLPMQLQALALAIAFAVFTGEAMAEQMVVELSDQASDWMQSPARARLGESGPETGTGGAGEEDKAKVRMQAAVKKALNDNSVDAVKELLLTNQAEANKKAARSELPTTTEGAEEVVKQMEDPVNAQNDNKPRKKTKEDIVKEKLAALLDKFERATSPDQAQIMKRKIAFYHRQLQKFDRIKQLAIAKLEIAQEKAAKMHRKFNIVAPSTLEKLRGMNNALDIHITSLDGQQAVASAQMEKESKLDGEKAQLQVKMHENEEYMKDKEEKVKKMAAELQQVQAQEATLQLEASKGHAKIKAAKAATAQDEAQLKLAKHTYESQEDQVKYLQAQMEDAVKMGDQARVQALTPSIEQQKTYAEQAKTVLASAAAATDEAKKAEVKASEIAVVNDELAKETLDRQVAATEQAKIAAAQNVTAAEAKVQQAKATKERVIALLNDLQVASGGNLTAADKTQVQMLQNQTKAADEEVMNDELKLDVAKKEENTTAVDSSDKVLQATEATNMVNVDKELMSEKLESKEMKKDLDSAEKEEVAAKALGKEEEKTMEHEEEEIKNEEKEQKEDQEATKLVAAEKAEKVVVEKVEKESEKQKEEIKEEAKEEIQSVDEQDAASEEIYKESKDIAAKSKQNTKDKEELKNLEKKEREKQAQMGFTSISAEKALIAQDIDELKEQALKLKQKIEAANIDIAARRGDMEESVGKQQKQLAKVSQKVMDMRIQAGKSKTMDTYRQAAADIKEIQRKEENVKERLKAAESGGVAKVKSKEKSVVQQAIEGAAELDNDKDESADLIMNANSALSKAEESAAPQSAPAQEGADAGVSVAAAKKIQKLEASKVADKNKALRNAEAKSEGEKMLVGAKLAAQEAALASMKTKLKGHTQAVARANAEAAKLVSQLQNTEMKSAQADIKSKLQTAREEAASEHHAVEGLVIKIAEAKIEMKHTEAEADNHAADTQQEIDTAEKEANTAQEEAKQQITALSKSASEESKSDANQVKNAELESEQVKAKKEQAEANVKSLEAKAANPEAAKDPEKQAALAANLQEEKAKMEKLESKADQAAANIASAQQAKASADTKRLEALVGKEKQAETEKKNAGEQSQERLKEQAEAEAKVAAKKAEVAETKAALQQADTPKKAEQLSTQLAAAEKSASRAEASAGAATQKAKDAVKKEEKVKEELAEDKKQVSAVKEPYQTKSDSVKAANTRKDYEEQLEAAVRKTGLKVQGKTSDWVQAAAQKLAAGDSSKGEKDAEDQTKKAQVSEAVAKATRPLKDKISEVQTANNALQQMVNDQLEQQKAKKVQAASDVGEAFAELNKAAAETTVAKPKVTSSTLNDVVNQAINNGGQDGVLGSMLDSLDHESDDLGDSMSSTTTAEHDKQMLDSIYGRLERSNPIELLQMSKWRWRGAVPATGIPAAPNTPESSDANVLYTQALAKADTMVQSRLSSKQSPRSAGTTPVDVASAKAAVAAAQNQIEEETKAMNDSTDKAQATQLAKKIEESKKELKKAHVEEQRAKTQAAVNKVEEEKAQLVAKEEAKGVSVQGTEAASIAVKNAIEEEAGDEKKVEDAEEKKGKLEASMKKATSVEQVDDLQTEIDADTSKLIAAKAALSKAVTTEANAGIAQVTSGVEAGVVSGTGALAQAEAIEKQKSRKNLNMAVEKVEEAKSKVKATKEKMEQETDTMKKVESAAKAAGNPDATAAAAHVINGLKAKMAEQREKEQVEKKELASAKSGAKAVLKGAEENSKKLDHAARQARRSIERNEASEGEILKDVAEKVKAAAVKAGADRAAAESLKKQVEKDKVAVSESTSAVMGIRAKQKAKEAEKEQLHQQKKAEAEMKEIKKQEAKASQVRKRLVGKIKAAVQKVVLAEPSTRTREERRADRQLRKDKAEAEKEKTKVKKADEQVERLGAQVERRKERLEAGETKVKEMQEQLRSPHMEGAQPVNPDDPSEQAASLDDESTKKSKGSSASSEEAKSNLNSKIKKAIKDQSKLQSELKQAEQKADTAEDAADATKRAEQKAERKVERASAKVAEAQAQKPKASEKNAAKTKAEAVAAQIEKAAAKSEAKEEKAEEAQVKQAEVKESEAREQLAEKAGTLDSSSQVEKLANSLLTKAGFKGVNA